GLATDVAREVAPDESDARLARNRFRVLRRRRPGYPPSADVLVGAVVRLTVPVLLLLLAAANARAATLDFLRDGAVVRPLDSAALERDCARTIELDDPYYEAHKRFSACPLATVVQMGFGVTPDKLEGDVVFRARDGYAKVSTPARVAEEGGFVALRDIDRPEG